MIRTYLFLSGIFLHFWVFSQHQLPADLPDYGVVVHTQNIEIHWAYPCGTSAGFFVVERSKDLLEIDSLAHLEYVCNVPGGLTSYSYKDIAPHRGISYYRVKQYSLNTHTYYYENWEQVSYGEGEGAYRSVFPNPIATQDFLQVEWENLSSREQVSIEWISPDGKNTVFVNQSYLPGIYSEKINTQGFGQGVYFLRLKIGEEIKVWKVVKL